MTQMPSPLDYEPPPGNDFSWLDLSIGVFVGLMLVLTSVVTSFGLYSTFDRLGVSVLKFSAGLFPFGAAIGYAGFQITRPKRRAFGIGVVVGLTLFAMIFQSVCGGLA